MPPSGSAGLVLFCISCAQNLYLTVSSQADIDTDVANLHAEAEEAWQRLEQTLERMRSAGFVFPASGQGQTLPTAGAGEISKGVGIDRFIESDVIQRLRYVQSRFSALQTEAAKIGQESWDNAALARNPRIGPYLDDLREFLPGLRAVCKELVVKYARVAGEPIDRTKIKGPKNKKSKIKIFSIAELSKEVRTKLSQDSRGYRVKAMEVVAIFQEDQLKMSDRQNDLQRLMNDPEGSNHDWPLTALDAKEIGNREQDITYEQQVLNQMLAGFGGLAGVHESGNEEVLEKLAVLGEMMVSYSILVEELVARIKKARGPQRRKRKKDKRRSQGPGSGGSLNDASGQKTHQENGIASSNGLPSGAPFSWLNSDQGAMGTTGAPLSQQADPSIRLRPTSNFGLQSAPPASAFGDGFGSGFRAAPSAKAFGLQGIPLASPVGGGFVSGVQGTTSGLLGRGLSDTQPPRFLGSGGGSGFQDTPSSSFGRSLPDTQPLNSLASELASGLQGGSPANSIGSGFSSWPQCAPPAFKPISMDSLEPHPSRDMAHAQPRVPFGSSSLPATPSSKPMGVASQTGSAWFYGNAVSSKDGLSGIPIDHGRPSRFEDLPSFGKFASGPSAFQQASNPDAGSTHLAEL